MAHGFTWFGEILVCCCLTCSAWLCLGVSPNHVPEAVRHYIRRFHSINLDRTQESSSRSHAFLYVLLACDFLRSVCCNPLHSAAFTVLTFFCTCTRRGAWHGRGNKRGKLHPFHSYILRGPEALSGIRIRT